MSPYVLKIDTWFVTCSGNSRYYHGELVNPLKKHHRKWFNLRYEYGTYLRTSFLANRRRTHCVTEGAKKEVFGYVNKDFEKLLADGTEDVLVPLFYRSKVVEIKKFLKRISVVRK